MMVIQLTHPMHGHRVFDVEQITVSKLANLLNQWRLHG